MESLGNRLKNRRKELGMTQGQLAEKLNIHQVTYQGYEKNKHKPDIDMLSMLADKLKISADYLLGRYKE